MRDTVLHRASDLAVLLEGDLFGDDVAIKLLSDKPLADAVMVISDLRQVAPLETQSLGLLVLDKEIKTQHNLIVVKDTRLALAQLSALFKPPVYVAEGIHPSASIHETAELAEDVHIAENVVIAAGVRVGKGTRVGANSVLAENVTVGENCTLYSNVSVYADARLANRVTLHAGVIIGSDGFGYAMSQKGAAKIYHLGNVVLEDDVEVGANTCIDRATLGETRIGARSKIDNLCQIGHNTIVGSDCLIAGTVAIAGSTTLGRGVILGGGAGVVDHVHLYDGVKVGARALVTKDIPAGQTWTGYPAEPYKKYVRKHYLLNQLERIWQSVKPLLKAKDAN